MKRFSFSRMKQRPQTSKFKEKDLYDPDQRPISISSKAIAKQREKSNSNASIIKPRVMTTNFINQTDNKSFFSNQQPAIYYDHKSQPNDNVDDFTSIKNYPHPIKTASVSIPLPDFDSQSDFDNNFSEESHHQNVVTRFIKTGYKLDRLGTNQTNQRKYNEDNEPASKIITLDRFGFRSPDEKEETNDQIKHEFIVQYLIDHTKHENARIIQKAFRLSRCRQHFNRFIRINLKLNYNLKKLTFICWQMTTTNQPQKMQLLFKKLKEVYKFFCLRFKIRELAPFRYFYVTHQLFLPKGYKPTTLYQYFYLMHWTDMTNILREWHRVAHLKRIHRKNLSRFLYPAKKFDSFGFIYHILVNWHRYSLWQSLARTNTQKKLITLDKWNKHAVNVFWNVKEHNLNSKRTRIRRAAEFSAKRIAAKAVRALYNRSIDSFSQMMINQSADLFRNRHLQTLSHRAWLKFMQKRLQELHIQRDIMRAWYSQSYQLAIKKLKTSLAEKLYAESFRQKVLNEWYREAHLNKFIHLKMTLRIHQHPSSMLLIIFALSGDYTLAFQILVFRMWIRYTRKRKRWKMFVRWCTQLNTKKQHLLTDDQPENELTPIAMKERGLIYLSDLIRAARLKLVKRGSVANIPFFPRSTWMSLEIMIRGLRMISFLNDHSSVDNETDFEKFFKEKNEENAWQFLTESSFKKKQPCSLINPSMFSCETLVRSLFLILHKHKDFEVLKYRNDIDEFDGNVEFEQLRSFKNLQAQADTNISIMRKHILEKVRRDHATMSIFVSHMQAEKMKTMNADFSTTLFSVVKNSDPNSITNSCAVSSRRSETIFDSQKLEVYPECNESIDFLIKETCLSEKRLKSTFERIKHAALSEFSLHFRSPSYFLSQNPLESVFVQGQQNRLNPNEISKNDSRESFIENSPSFLLLNNTINSSKSSLINPSNSSQSLLINSSSSILNNSLLLNTSSTSFFYNSLLNNSGGSDGINKSDSLSNDVTLNKISKSPSTKNPLIIQYIKPKQISHVSSGISALLESNDFQENNLNLGFNLINFKRVLERFHSQELITSALASFFINVCHVYIDVSDAKSLSKPDELLLSRPTFDLAPEESNEEQKNAEADQHQENQPNPVNQLENKEPNLNEKIESDSNEDKSSESVIEEKLAVPACLQYEILIQTKRRLMNKNIKFFIADFNGITDYDSIPLKINIPNVLSDCISSIFTIFVALKKTPNLSQYLDATPFATLLKSTDPLLVTTQEKAWIAMKEMFPKLEIPTETSLAQYTSLNTMNKKRSLFASSMFSIPSQQPIVDDNMGSNEAFLACWLLPYILSFDSIIDFIREEILAPHNQRK